MKIKRKSFVRRLTSRFVVGTLIAVLCISYTLYYLEGRATRQFYSEIYHNKMLITNEYTRRVCTWR